MTKIFISQPMKNKTNEEIEHQRNRAIQFVNEIFEDVEILETFYKNSTNLPLQSLGKAIEQLAVADYVILCKGWETARGCRIEKLCCQEYGIETIEIHL